VIILATLLFIALILSACTLAVFGLAVLDI
jgi:hypothetical protein